QYHCPECDELGQAIIKLTGYEPWFYVFAFVGGLVGCAVGFGVTAIAASLNMPVKALYLITVVSLIPVFVIFGVAMRIAKRGGKCYCKECGWKGPIALARKSGR
ncbi:MAG: hypothetical protein P1V97_31120, partial [Planctomycetota bacterium]|nr:hypothetical protein [Planctomycetota bacterium]